MSRTHRITQSLSPEYVVLALLALQPCHGYELHQRLGSDLGHVWRISLSQVYNIITRLEEQGMVTSEWVSQENLPDRQRCQVTEVGARHLQTWVDTPVGPSVRAVRMAFTTKLYLARARGEPPIEDLIRGQKEAIEDGLQRLRRSVRTLPPEQLCNRLSLRLRISQLQSLLQWLEECRQVHIS